MEKYKETFTIRHFLKHNLNSEHFTNNDCVFVTVLHIVVVEVINSRCDCYAMASRSWSLYSLNRSTSTSLIYIQPWMIIILTFLVQRRLLCAVLNFDKYIYSQNDDVNDIPIIFYTVFSKRRCILLLFYLHLICLSKYKYIMFCFWSCAWTGSLYKTFNSIEITNKWKGDTMAIRVCLQLNC